MGKAGAAGKTGATGATGAIGPAGAPNRDAANSAALGGVPAAGYVQNSCGVVDGAVKGFVQVDASSAFPNTFTPIVGYNCSGQDIEVERMGAGSYVVDFTGSPVTISVGTVSQAQAPTGNPVDAFVSILIRGSGSFQVQIYNDLGNLVDVPFALVTP